MMNTISSLRICLYYLRGFAKNDNKLQTEKLEAATKYHDIVGMLDTHLNQDEVDVMVKNNKTFFQNFLEAILIPSRSRGIMVLIRKSCPFTLNCHQVVTPSCLAVKLTSASKQELEIAFVYNPNDEVDKIKNLKAAVIHLVENGCANQLIIGDYNCSMNNEYSSVMLGISKILIIHL